MEKNKTALVVIIIVAVVAIGVTSYALMSGNKAQTSETQGSAESMGMTDEEHANMKDSDAKTGSTVIRFTNDGFDKETYTAKDGEAVTVKNDSDMDVEFSSDDHPTHREHPELNMEVLSPGKSDTFTPPGKGTYKFHDHINDQYTGTLTVE